ncbi:hypothetical protein VR45_29775 [Streptomyces sp. NRRL S-495]|nr:hypothetical protein VR45_29775 [Streptomyces sp. NRRL S-495]
MDNSRDRTGAAGRAGAGTATVVPFERGPFAGLGADDLRTLHGLGTKRVYAHNEALMIEGEPGDRVVVLLTGRVKVLAATEDGGPAGEQPPVVAQADQGRQVAAVLDLDRRRSAPRATGLRAGLLGTDGRSGEAGTEVDGQRQNPLRQPGGTPLRQPARVAPRPPDRGAASSLGTAFDRDTVS